MFRRVNEGIILIILVFLFWSCAKKVEPPSVVIWTGMVNQSEIEMLRGLAKEFRDSTGVEVKVFTVPFSDLQNKFQIAAPTGQGPDIITGPQDWIGIFGAANLILPLPEGFLTSEEERDFLPLSLAGMSYEGKRDGLPLTVEAIAIIYNKNLLPTLPSTMEELLKEAVSLTDKEKGKFGFLFDITNFYYCYPFFSARGAYAFGYDKEKGYIPEDLGLCGPQAVEAATLLYDLMSGKYKLIPLGTNYDSMQSEFMGEKVAMIINGPWAVGDYKKAGINYGVMPFPPFKDGKYPHPLVGVLGVMVNKKAKHINEALKFVKFMNSLENQLKIYKALQRIPARRSAWQDPAIANDPDMQAFIKSAELGEPMPNIPVMSCIWQPMAEELTLIVKGQVPPDEGINIACRRMKAAIERLLR